MKNGRRILLIACMCCMCLASLMVYSFKFKNVTLVNWNTFISGGEADSGTYTTRNTTDSLGRSIPTFRAQARNTTVNVPKMCEKICDKGLQTCVDPNLAILVYNKSSPDRMNFKQSFSSFLVSINETGSEKNGSNVWSRKRSYCPITDLDPSFQTMRMQNSCALIGNSGILLNSSCGSEINSHDFVIRANMAKLDGYTDDVGNKTNVMMINGESLRNLYSKLFAKQASAQSKDSFRDLMNHLETLSDGIIWFAKSTNARGYAGKLKKIAAFLRDRLKVRFGFSMFSVGKATSRRWNTKSYPTSGLMILTVAESFCKHITLYGFYPYQNDSTGARILHHYYEPNLLDFHTKNHDFEEEHQLLKSLHKNGSLRMVLTPCKKDGVKNSGV